MYTIERMVPFIVMQCTHCTRRESEHAGHKALVLETTLKNLLLKLLKKITLYYNIFLKTQNIKSTVRNLFYNGF